MLSSDMSCCHFGHFVNVAITRLCLSSESLKDDGKSVGSRPFRPKWTLFRSETGPPRHELLRTENTYKDLMKLHIRSLESEVFKCLA